jgi:hypothetical protein
MTDPIRGQQLLVGVISMTGVNGYVDVTLFCFRENKFSVRLRLFSRKQNNYLWGGD